MAKKFEFDLVMVKKYAFWVCVPLGLIIAMLLGMLAIADVGRSLEERKKQLDSQKAAMETLRSGATKHPNQATIDEINEKREDLGQKVLTAWETLVERQQDRNRWEGLADRAVQDIKRKNFLDPLEPATLNSYLNFARDDIKKLLDKANINRVQLYRRSQDGREELLDPKSNEPLLSEGTGGMRGNTGRGMRGDMGGSSRGRGTPDAPGTSGTVVMKGKVVWENPQLDITMKNWNDQPQSFEVWLTQEDLWVYQALLWVVAESNKDSREASKISTGRTQGAGGGAGSPASGAGAVRPLDLSDSVVKEIVELSIGRTAATELATQSSRRINSGSGGGGMGSEMGFGGSGGFGGSSGFGDSSSGGFGGMGGGMTAEALKSMALAGRYVDDAGSPLMEANFTGQFRRMPIYLRFVVDQRRIADVLANCANCPMPIDVLWVTINPEGTQSFDYASATGTGAGMGSESFSVRPSRGAGGRSEGTRRSTIRDGSGSASGIIGLPTQTGGGRGGGTGVSEIDYGHDAVTIDIRGCINIFAPPDETKITGGASGTP
jgi:uncharacterized membrane-anchored protein YhcB (DUF1043 family)